MLFFFGWIVSLVKAIPLTRSSYSEIIENPQKIPIFMKFFNPWCHHCQHFAPIWDKFSETADNSSFLVAEVNCQDEKKICEEFKVDVFPTVMWYDPVKKKQTIYDDERTPEQLQAFAERQFLFPFFRASNFDSISFRKPYLNFFVYEYEKIDSNNYKIIKDVFLSIEKYRMAVFAIPSNRDHLSFYEFEDKFELEGEFNKENIRKFIEKHYMSFFFDVKISHIQERRNIQKPLIIFFVFGDNSQAALLRKEFWSLKDQYLFAWNNYYQSDPIVRDLFYSPSVSETYFAYLDPQKDLYKTAVNVITKDALEKWIQKEVTGNKEGWSKLYGRQALPDLRPIFSENKKSTDPKPTQDQYNYPTGILIFLFYGLCFGFLLVALTAPKWNIFNKVRSPGQPLIEA